MFSLMFTGIVEELGAVQKIARQGQVHLLEIKAKRVLEDTGIGDSIAVNGVCLTVVKKTSDSLSFEAIPETLKVTNLGKLHSADKVNLERSLKAGERLSGHFVSGHIDCVGTIRKKQHAGGAMRLEIALPQQFLRYILPKGSIAIDGISLTVAEKKSSTFSVNIIPHTLKNTTLDLLGPSSQVNIECDLLVKSAAMGY